MSSLNVVCLISGGKDSLFSILHCKKNGHNIVALANLHPPHHAGQDQVEDLDSFMYQTVGHQVIPLYEKALGLPLYRQEILGSAVNQDKCYGVDDGNDEVEASLPLLKNVTAHHPEVNAVSTGAILSDYQRTRVESVAVRLGLTPLSYLWQYPNLLPHTQITLLEDMAAVGQDSRIVKVASGGLDDSFLWQDVADPRTISRLDKATGRFGSGDDGAVLGEGGEYETLAIAGPAPLWRGRIDVGKAQRRILPGEAGSFSLSVSGARLDAPKNQHASLKGLRNPLLLEPAFQATLDDIENESSFPQEGDAWKSFPVFYESTNGPDNDALPDSARPDSHFWPDVTGEGSNIVEEVQSIMEETKERLLRSGRSFADVVYCSIILRDMVDFAAVNAVYGTFFSRPNPPARVTIACAGVLPAHKHLMMSFTVSDPLKRASRHGLHVQSRSYWAPANIGPYSQAISVAMEAAVAPSGGSVVYISGQIPLIPASMNLAISLEDDTLEMFSLQTVLALQHAVRIGRAMYVRRWLAAIAFVSLKDFDKDCRYGNIVLQTWKALHQQTHSASSNAEESADVGYDLWDLKHGAARGDGSRHVNSNQSHQHIPSSTHRPLLYIIGVDALPRGASVEFATFGSTVDAADLDMPEVRHYLRTFKSYVFRP